MIHASTCTMGTRDGQPVFPTPATPRKIAIEKAVDGVLGDTSCTRDVRDKVRALADNGQNPDTITLLDSPTGRPDPVVRLCRNARGNISREAWEPVRGKWLSIPSGVAPRR
jgi:hypothetical protein